MEQQETQKPGASATGKAELSLHAVSFEYEAGVPVLRDVTMAIPRGGLVAILGPNGSGKTTVLRLLAGLVAPLTGTVVVGGRNLSSIPRADIARRIALVPQETHAAFDYTVLEMAMMGRYPHLRAFEVEGPNDLDIVRDALRATGTLGFESRLFNTLSGGEKQRVVIAAALAQAPDILLLDEPTASLDLAYQLEVRAILESLNTERGLTIVISTHDLNLAAALCRDVVLLHRGEVLASGPSAAMMDAALIERLYGVRVDVTTHVPTGRLSVVPIARSQDSARS